MKNFFTLLLALVALNLGAQTNIWSEDFENGLPAGWTTTGEFKHGEALDFGTSQSFEFPEHTFFVGVNDDILGDGVSGDGTFTTGPIDLTTATGQAILFFETFWIDGDYLGADETAVVDISVDGGATWNLLLDLEGLGKPAWRTAFVDLEAYKGKTIQLRFTYEDGDGWNWAWGIDDMRIGTPKYQREARPENYTGYINALNGKSLGTSFGLVNEGFQTITSCEVTSTFNGQSTTKTITGLNIPFQGAANVFLDNVTWVDGANDLVITVNKINGQNDEDASNNEISATLTGFQPGAPGKKIWVEEATGTWCTWCPRGAVGLDRLAKGFDDHFVGIAVHNNDPMAFAAYDDGLNSASFPNARYQRTTWVDPGDVEADLLNDMTVDAKAYVTARAQYDAAGSTVKVIVDIVPLVALTGNHRIVANLTEDGVTGVTATGELWDQVNAYSGGGAGPMGGFEYLPSPVPSDLMVYDHVARALFTVFAGKAGLLPNPMAAGETYTVELDVADVDPTWNLDNCHINAALLNQQGRVVNAGASTWNKAIAATTGAGDPITEAVSVSVSPNPFAEVANVRIKLNEPTAVNVAVFNSLGQLISTRDYGKQVGDLVYPFSADGLPADTYFFEVRTGEKTAIYKATLAK